ncbi:MAG: hypothetical protein ACF8TS_03455 [Maioricimonas sp. JB049]
MSLSARRFRSCIRHGLVLLLVGGFVPAVASAQQDGTPRTQLLRSATDGAPVYITYYPALEDRNPRGVMNAGVVVLLHEQGGSRLVWDKTSAPPGGKPFAEVLQTQGYAVITVDLRKHGESLVEGMTPTVKVSDYGQMVLGDMVAVKKFIFDEHQRQKLNMNKLAIVAAGMSAPIAAAYAEADWRIPPYDDSPTPANRTPRGQDVRALVLLSPDSTAGRVNLARSLKFLQTPQMGIAFLIIAGTRDAQDRNQARNAYQVVSANRHNADRTYFERPNTNARGTDLLANPAAKAEILILNFLDKHLKKLDSEWQDRRSRLDR